LNYEPFAALASISALRKLAQDVLGQGVSEGSPPVVPIPNEWDMLRVVTRAQEALERQIKYVARASKEIRVEGRAVSDE
jgi:hypothetical protein